MASQTEYFLIAGLLLSGCASPRQSLIPNGHSIQAASDSELALVLYISRAEFNQLRLDYNSDAVAKWSERLQNLKQGMTRLEVLAVLAPEGSRGSQFMPLGVVTGSGSHETWLLDDAYCASLTFSIPLQLVGKPGPTSSNQLPGDYSHTTKPTDTLFYADKSPTTITYRVR